MYFSCYLCGYMPKPYLFGCIQKNVPSSRGGESLARLGLALEV